MLYEYRRYDAMPGRLRDLHRRFEDLTLRLFEKHAIEAVGFWDVVIGDSNQMHYLLRWQSMREREEKWAELVADPEWAEGFARSEASGALAARIHNEFWRPTPYSKLK